MSITFLIVSLPVYFTEEQTYKGFGKLCLSMHYKWINFDFKELFKTWADEQKNDWNVSYLTSTLQWTFMRNSDRLVQNFCISFTNEMELQ